MNTAKKGRRNEHRTKEILEADGYIVTRSAASKGAVDLIGIKEDGILLVQVKTNKGCGRAELETFRGMKVPACVTKQVYVWKDYQRLPTVMTV